MPPKKSTATEGESAVPMLTETEVKFVKAVFDSMNTRPDIDYENVAGIMGLANGKSARDRLRTISKKHGWSATDGSSGGSPAKKPVGVKKTPVKKKGIAQRKKKTTKKTESSGSDVDEDISGKLESDTDGEAAAKAELNNPDSDSD
ncbi:hypothetical protein HER10_EVM0006215 [Colletotrichum scovillei]|uniref:Uncharacterized protein n=1 Tax=Colletotrichum scovillei TaxID=1209932 RepID=A0A9P7UKK8_9PEZI|nr:uncharacterized protein HER10_EVM0006215 [Colletotrichum scovillei]KAF4776438.1 hypothetical protein HER10_EVM0006215 [Colletotrichum scovillei]KAG7054025.1 hypothetical protein JMJ77_0001101 [Colletotrichum scovillei]KAG7072320.1 hypothetical protein JMJ76_0005176 [Colletotrichum scovillei]KAG7080564.1 hypothetical protein JMJ78_0007655 [Colletotrichum scovillei]